MNAAVAEYKRNAMACTRSMCPRAPVARWCQVQSGARRVACAGQGGWREKFILHAGVRVKTGDRAGHSMRVELFSNPPVNSSSKFNRSNIGTLYRWTVVERRYALGTVNKETKIAATSLAPAFSSGRLRWNGLELGHGVDFLAVCDEIDRRRLPHAADARFLQAGAVLTPLSSLRLRC